jgi:uncharacterized protein (DUF1330 family)
MSAYVILQITVDDPSRYQEYVKMGPPTVSLYGGKYLVRGGKMEMVEGDWKPERIVILEFESMEKAKAWIDSPEYAPARAIRHASAHTHAIIVEGVPQVLLE